MRLLPKVLSYFVTYYVTSEADTPILSPAQQTVIYITENVSSELTLAVWVIGVASVVRCGHCCFVQLLLYGYGLHVVAREVAFRSDGVVCSRRLWACCKRVSRMLSASAVFHCVAVAVSVGAKRLQHSDAR